MTRAAQVTFDSLFEFCPTAKSVCVICGVGNNGGDGFVVARLALQAGFEVTVLQLGNAEIIKGDALTARKSYLETGSKISEFNQQSLDADILVDAIFGTGLTRQVEGSWAEAIYAINQSHAKVIAVDVPSGLNSDTGAILGTAVKADLTITYIGRKCGLYTGQARDIVGKLKFDNLSLPNAIYQQLAEKPCKTIIPNTITQQTLKPRLRCSHKGSFGHVLLIGGAQGMSGAIQLAGEACLRTGAGLVSVATDCAHADYINTTRPELMVTGVQQADALLPLIKKASVIAIGPGLGKSDWAKELLLSVLKSDKPKVLDADALNLLSELPVSKMDNWILTPHPAEAARLLSIETQQIEADRYANAEEIVKNRGGVLLLKGAGTLISDGSSTAVCTAGNPGMASGGMGDVLTGIIVALLAQGLSLFDAAQAGALLHAKAADLAAAKGERGLCASDLFPYLQKLVNQ
jgi:NAD(P)H-hydrate epimerase